MVTLKGDIVTVHEWQCYHLRPDYVPGGQAVWLPNADTEFSTDHGKSDVLDSAGQFWLVETREKLFRPNGGV